VGALDTGFRVLRQTDIIGKAVTVVTSLTIIFVIGALTIALWVVFVYVTMRGVVKAEIPGESFSALLEVGSPQERGPLKVLLAIDGSAASVTAIEEVARCPLPHGSTIEVLYAIHSQVPLVPDFPPWAVTAAATHAESIRDQSSRAPELLEAAAKHLRPHHRHATITTKMVEGAPKDEILREAAAWGADRIVLGSHGRGRVDRALLGSTAAGVAAEAPCTVHIARPFPPSENSAPLEQR
jgi:nucleotide-binding universal stress UspA family protein